MPLPGCVWRHVIVSTYGSWLPGDARGFRSRHHKIHSSGDYKAPPPPEEHAGLRESNRDVKKVILPNDLKRTVGEAIIAKLQKFGYRVNAVSVAPTHSHWLAELPDDKSAAWNVAGQAKSAASLAVRQAIPGGIWAIRGKMLRVETRRYLLAVFRYILGQDDSWVWSVNQETDD
ncbi:MAG: hypothetical protein U0744_06360 [Gemmataceae bacterium]